MSAHTSTRFEFSQSLARLATNLYALVLVALALACVSAAQNTRPNVVMGGPVQPLKPNLVRFTGTVVDSVTGAPLVRALVNLQGMQNRVALTDSQGKFTFDGVPEGRWPVRVRKPGYTETARTSSVAQFVEIKGEDSNAIITAVPQAVIRGRVTTSDDEPVEGLPVDIGVYQVREGRRQFTAINSKRTDEDGRFRIADLPPGTYFLSVGPATAREFENRGTSIARVYYPGVAERASAASVQLSPGQQFEANLTVSRVPGFRISGTVSSEGAPQFLSIELTDSSGVSAAPGFRRAVSGVFELPPVAPGNYILRARGGDEKGRPLYASIPVSVRSDVTGIHLTLRPYASIPVVVRTELKNWDEEGRWKGGPEPHGSGIIGSVMSASGSRPRQRFVMPRLVPTDGEDPYSYPMFDPPEEDKAISIKAAAGKYNVEFPTMGPWYVASAKSGSTNLLTDPLVVPESGRVDPIEVVVRDDGSSLNGKINGGSESGLVLAVPEHSSRVRPFVSNFFGYSDARFYFPQLPPGEYALYAFNGEDAIEYSNPEAMERYSSKAKHIRVEPGDRNPQVTLDVIEVDEQ